MKSALVKSLGYKFTAPGYRGGFSPYGGAPKPAKAMYGGYQAPKSTAFGGPALGGGAQGTIGASTYTPPKPNGTALTAPTAPVPIPGAAPITSPTTDPRDPTYWSDVGQLNFAYNNAVAGLNTRDVNAQTKLSNSLAEFNRTEPIDTQHLRENYNDKGAFYSGHLGEATGNLVADYARRRAAARDEFGLEHGDYLSSLTGLKDKLGLDMGSELSAAGERQGTRDQGTADNNGLAQLIQALSGGSKPTPTSQTNQATTTTPNYKTVPYTNSQGVKGVLHIYPDGRKVFVRGATTTTSGAMYGGYKAPTSSAWGGTL